MSLFYTPKVRDQISSTILRLKLKRLAPEAYIHCSDKVYDIPKDPVKVMAKFSPFKLPYIKEKRDCDDFVRIFRGKLSSKGIGNLLAMDCIIKLPNGGIHAVIAFLIHGRLGFGEPQTGKMITYEPLKVIRLIA